MTRNAIIGQAQTTMVAERYRDFISMGKPTCDVCRALDPEDRSDEGDFWPDTLTVYLKGDESAAFKFMAQSVCSHHDTEEHQPEDATHRVIDEPEPADDSRYKCGYNHTVKEIEEL